MIGRMIGLRTPSYVRLGLPCEQVTTHLLPQLRRLLAREFVNKHGMSQIWTAKILNVTQPAISNYVHSDQKPRTGSLKENLELKKTVEGLADDLINGRLTQLDFMRVICSLCIKMRNMGPICTIHGEAVPSVQPGRCSFCLEDYLNIKTRSREEFKILEDVRRAIQLMEEEEMAAALIPEIGMNIAYAKSGAMSVEEVVGIPGRIHPIRGRPRGSNPPKFGGSSHVARAVLTIMRFEPQLRSAISLRFHWEFIDICKELELTISSFDRAVEPPEVKRVDDRTIPWGVEQAVNKIGRAPQVIYDLGDMGKEPMIFLFGQTPQRVAQTTLKIAREYAKR